mmetsp:Transcript_9311/g.34449  ORF Transcript_9311/g.34449 Transcript_9311/m.34449 type:complete len:143 (+) Transcript_9311:35-463(+)
MSAASRLLSCILFIFIIIVFASDAFTAHSSSRNTAVTDNHIYSPDPEYLTKQDQFKGIQQQSPLDLRKEEMESVLHSYQLMQDELLQKAKLETNHQSHAGCQHKVRVCKLECPVNERGSRLFSCLQACEKKMNCDGTNHKEL